MGKQRTFVLLKNARALATKGLLACVMSAKIAKIQAIFVLSHMLVAKVRRACTFTYPS